MTPSRIPTSLRWPRPLLWSAVALLSTVYAFPARASEQESAASPMLAGAWKLDVGKSDNAQEKMQAMRGSGGRGPRGGGMGGGFGGGGGGMRGGGMRGGMGGGRPRGGPGEGPDDSAARDRQRGPEMRLIMKPPASMLIEQTDSTVVLFEQGLPIEVLVVGPPQDKAGTIDPEAPHITASWNGSRLLTLREDERGGRATQQFALSADGKSFTLTLRREPRDDAPALEIKREYRREDAD
jgi:hypothetical protein